MNKKELYARVCVDSMSPALEESYTYHVPEELEPYISVGARVSVPFAHRPALGYILELSHETDYKGEIKDVREILDFHRELSDEQISLARFISHDTLTPLPQVLRSLLPGFLRTRYRRTVTDIDYDALDPDLVLPFQRAPKVEITTSLKPYLPKIRREEEKGHLRIGYDIARYGKNYAEKAWRLAEGVIAREAKQENRRTVIEYLAVKGDGTLEEIKAGTGCSVYLVHKMEKEGLITSFERLPREVRMEEKRFRPFLRTYDDEHCAALFRERKGPGERFLLTGEDGFRSRFVFERSREVIESGRTVLIVTPTIVKNEEVKKFFRKNSKNLRIAEFSSRVKESAFYQHYLAASQGKVDVIITTTIGLGLPFVNLGLIVMTDEENFNYISETTPKTDAHDVLAFRARAHKCPLILASPTPSIESGYQAFRAQLTLLSESETAKPVTFVPLKDLPAEDQLVSATLAEAIKANLAQGGMTLLVLNAVGYSHALLCRSCGEIIRCPKCKAPLYYYKDKNLLKCNHCDYRSLGLICPKCGSTDIIPLGAGLEKLAERVRTLFPEAVIAQMDYTLATSRETYETFLLSLEDAHAPIVIGTSALLALSDPRLTLVGIIASDASLAMPSYRAAESTYALLARGALKKNARLIVQGFNLDHFAIRDGAKADYASFFNEEIRNRRAYDYPPFTKLLSFTIHGPFEPMYHAANYFKKALAAIVHGSIIGPSYSREKRGIVLEVRHAGEIERILKLYQDVARKFMPEQVLIDYARHVR